MSDEQVNAIILEELRYIRKQVDDVKADMNALKVKVALISLFVGFAGSKIEILKKLF